MAEIAGDLHVINSGEMYRVFLPSYNTLRSGVGGLYAYNRRNRLVWIPIDRIEKIVFDDTSKYDTQSYG